MTPIEAIYLSIQRSLSGAARLQIASDMSTAARELAQRSILTPPAAPPLT